MKVGGIVGRGEVGMGGDGNKGRGEVGMGIRDDEK